MLKYLLLALFAFGKVAFSTDTELEQCRCTCHEKREKPRTRYIEPDAFLFNEIGQTTYLTFASLGRNGYGPAYFVQLNYFYEESSWAYISQFFPHWLKGPSLKQFELVPTANGTYRIKSNRGQESFLAAQAPKKNSWQWAYFATEKFLKSNPSYISDFEIVAINDDESFHIRMPKTNCAFSVAVEKDTSLGIGPVSYAFFADDHYLDEKNTDYFDCYDWKYSFKFRFRQDLEQMLKPMN